MKIKKRLFLSNIVMIIFPFIVTIIYLMMVNFILPYFKISDTNYENIIFFAKEKINFSTVDERFFINKEDKLLNKDYQNYVTVQLKDEDIDFVVIKNNQQQFYSKKISEIDIEKTIQRTKGMFLNNNIEIDGNVYRCNKTNLNFNDGSQGMVLVFKEISTDNKIVEIFIYSIVLVFLLSFFCGNFMLVWIFSKDVLTPVIEIKKATRKISEGDLEYIVFEKGKGEIRELSRDFEEMRLKLKEYVNTRKKYDENRKFLISSISHDLKTPITAIKGYIEGVLDGVAKEPDKIKEYLNISKARAIQMDSMIDDLLLYSRLDLNNETFNFEKTNILQYIKDCVFEFTYEFETQGINLEFVNKIKETKYVRIDRAKLQRVITNIIDNSRKYMDKEEKELKIVLRENKTEVIIEIIDNGCGIGDKNISNIFNRFYREDEARTRTNGSGIGLAIAKQIVEGLGGKIWAKSKEKEGTTILITLKTYLGITK